MMSSQSVDTGSNQTNPPSKRMLLVSVSKNALPWVPVEVDKPMDVATEDRVIEKKVVREERAHRAHLVRYEMHKPIVFHHIHRLPCFKVSQPELNPAPESKSTEKIQFDRQEPREMDMEQARARHELSMEKMKVSMIKTREIKKEDIGRKIDTVRTEVFGSIEKPPACDDEDDAN